MPEAVRLFKTYSIRYRELKTITADHLSKFKKVMDKQSGIVELNDYARLVKIDPSLLKSHYFNGLFEDSDKIQIKTAIEAVLRARESVSMSLIDQLDVDEIVLLVGDEKLRDPDRMFDFLQINP